MRFVCMGAIAAAAAVRVAAAAAVACPHSFQAMMMLTVCVTTIMRITIMMTIIPITTRSYTIMIIPIVMMTRRAMLEVHVLRLPCHQCLHTGGRPAELVIQRPRRKARPSLLAQARCGGSSAAAISMRLQSRLLCKVWGCLALSLAHRSIPVLLMHRSALQT